MVDWFVLLVPIAVLPIVLLFVFVGCQLVFPVESSFASVALAISPKCDTAASSIKIKFSSLINDEIFNTTLAPVPAEGITISTEELKIAVGDSGTVWCAVTITPLEGEPFNLLPAGQEKIEDEFLEPFTLFCVDGDFELS